MVRKHCIRKIAISIWGWGWEIDTQRGPSPTKGNVGGLLRQGGTQRRESADIEL